MVVNLSDENKKLGFMIIFIELCHVCGYNEWKRFFYPHSAGFVSLVCL